jgi:hypothetical protein
MKKDNYSAAPPLSDDEVRLLIERHNIPASDANKFGESLRQDFEIYERDRNRPNVNDCYDEIARLHQAAEKRDVRVLAIHLSKLSPEIRARLEERAARIRVILPSPDELKDAAKRETACETVARLCQIGGKWTTGRLRPSGKRSRTWEPSLYASKKKHVPKRDAERDFVAHLRCTWRYATAEWPARTADPRQPGPFARFVAECLKLTTLLAHKTKPVPKKADCQVATGDIKRIK